MDELLRRREVAAQIHASESTVRRYGRDGILEEVRIGPGIVRVKASSVARLIENGYTAPGPQEAA